MHIIFTAIAAILIFAIMILIHELGHFIAAKAFGVKVNEFALGMGPKLFSRQKGETLYSVRVIPIGGFCAMEGEDTKTEDERAFSNKKPLARLIILVAGAFMNILLGFILLFSLAVGEPKLVVPQVESVISGGAAQEAGLKENDVVVRANGKRVHIAEDLSWAISHNPQENRTLHLVVEHDGQKRTVSITPREDNGNYRYGIQLKSVENTVFQTLKNAWYQTSFYSGVIVNSFISMIRGDIPLSQVSGPVGIVSEIGNVVEQTRTEGLVGFQNLLSLTILLTINLGVFNLFPLPALDGGRILFVLLELVRRKPLPQEKEALVHFIGLVLLIAISILITFKDVFMLWN